MVSDEEQLKRLTDSLTPLYEKLTGKSSKDVPIADQFYELDFKFPENPTFKAIVDGWIVGTGNNVESFLARINKK
ncbi:hypothetical protein [Lentilactobacillus senioris]|uniref:hypothetical protein n=1 Tax=Lentilactobacillus senioris TaxID=931534 RepID=UPI003D29907B